MAPTRFVVLTVLMAFVYVDAEAATQRLAVLSCGPLKLGPKGSPEGRRLVPCYCMDQCLLAPPTGSALHQISTGAKSAFVKVGAAEPIPLSEAITAGKLKLKCDLRGTGIRLELVSNTDEELEIDFKSDTFFSDDAHRGVEGININGIKAVDRGAPGTAQMEFWKANFASRVQSTIQAAVQAESFDGLVAMHRDDVQLATKGLDLGLLALTKIDGGALVLLRSRPEVAGFELYKVSGGESKLVAKGLDAALQLVSQLSSPSEFCGIQDAFREVATFYKEGSDTVVLTRKSASLTWGFELRRVSGEKSEVLARETEAIARAAVHFRTPAEFEAIGGTPYPLLTFCHDGSSTLVLVRNGFFGPLELWRVTADKAEIVKRGGEAVTYLDEVQKQLAKAKSDENSVFLYVPTAKNGSRGGDRPPVGRPPLGTSGWSDPDGFRFQFGATEVKVSRDQVANFLGGRDINPELDRSLREAIGTRSLILMRDPFTRGSDLGRPYPKAFGPYDANRVYFDPVRLAVELQRRYPDARVYLDDPSEMDKVRERVATIYKIGGPNDVAVIHDPSKSFQDYNIFDTFKEFLEAALPKNSVKIHSIPFAEAGLPGNVPEPNLVVLSGHKGDRFRTYVDRLARSGKFKDKVVALFSCYEVAEEGFNSRLITREAGAKAVLYFTTRIDAAATARVLQELSMRLDKIENGGADKPDLRGLLNESINEELKKPGLSEPEKNELQKMRQAVIQVSDAHPAVPAYGALAG